MSLPDNVVDISSKELAILLENRTCVIQHGLNKLLIACKHWHLNEHVYNIKDVEPNGWKLVGCVLDGPDKYNFVAVLRDSVDIKNVIDAYNAKQVFEEDKIKDY